MVFTDSKSIEKYTGIKNIFLAEGSKITINGNVTLNPNIYFRSNCILNDGCFVDSGSVLNNVSIGKNTKIRAYSNISDTNIGINGIIGPFCFIRESCNIGDDCIVGSYVEVTRSKICDQVKISHQSFLGDAIINEGTIIGAGVVFCNYDKGERKNTFIGKNSLIGSGTMLIAPLNIGEKVVVGAGSVINKNIPNDSKIIQKKRSLKHDHK